MNYKGKNAARRAIERFGLDPEASLPDVVLLDKPLPQGEKKMVVLSKDTPLGGVLNTVSCYDIDELKHMIGVPNRLAKLKKKKSKLRNEFSQEKIKKCYKSSAYTYEHQRVITAVGRTYMYGNSELVSNYKRVLETIFTRGADSFQIVVACFGTIRVQNGWDFVITPSVQSICIDTLLLEPDAGIRRRGNADFNFNIGTMRVVEPLGPESTTI